MTARMRRIEKWSYAEFPLTNAVSVERGEMACIDTSTGLMTKGATSTTLRPVGYFEEDATGDGTTLVRIELFQEVVLHWFDNDTGGTPVVATDLGGLCYILDDRTVTGDATGASAAGRVWAVDSTEGVLVEMLGFDSV